VREHLHGAFVLRASSRFEPLEAVLAEGFADDQPNGFGR
jgi:hypothetical protein